MQMASKKKKNEEGKIKFNALRKIASRIQSNNDSIYRSTYYSDPDNKQMLQTLKTDIDNSIKSIMKQSSDNIGEPNVSKLYERIFAVQNDTSTSDEFKKIFEDNEFIADLTNSYLENKYIKMQDDEIDDILKYMPKLKEALNTLRDNVLSADSFSKDFLSINNDLDGTEQVQFSNNIDIIKKKYQALKLVSDTYDNASTYGEEFIYCVPYATAIERLLNSKNNTTTISTKNRLKEHKVEIISESGIEVVNTDDYAMDENTASKVNCTFELNKSGIISSIVQTEYEARAKQQKLSEQSVCEQFLQEHAFNEDGLPSHFNKLTDNDLEMNKKLPVHHRFDATLHDDLELPDIDDTTADGLYTGDKSKNVKVKNMNGCIVKRLRRDRVRPLYLNDDICLGYYYFEYDDNDDIFMDRPTGSTLNNTITGLRNNGRYDYYDQIQQKEDLTRYLAAQLSDKIDAEFVNANQDLKKEIYYILKYNQQYGDGTNTINNVRVTYIPPQDIHHIHFKFNPNTHRGVSDLAMSMIPAKLWVCIYITNCLGVMTRSNDKRVYYVKQSVETNITKTLLKTINEIKKSNFGIRQIENINNVLNITGRYNDYIIPRGADGSSPVDFEVMQGQDIPIKTELMEILEEAAINITGVPLEIIQNRISADYAIQLTMQNSKFLRFVYSRQSDYQEQLSALFTKIYNYEFGTNIGLKVTLPPPLFINLTNTNQLIVNSREYSTSIAELMLSDKDDITKNIFIRDYTAYNLGSYINLNVVYDHINKAEQQAKKIAAETAENEEY